MLGENLVFPLSSQKIRPAVEVLARAFFNDPFFVYAIRDEQKRRLLLLWLFERQVRYALRYGRAFTTETLSGAALWLGPREPHFTLQGTIRTGMFLLPLKLSRLELRRSLKLSRCTDALHKEAIAGPHWYLCALGVEPSMQGRGVGRALLQPMLETASRAGVPCYLDTNNEKNVSFYLGCGFEVVRQGQADPASPGVWGMIKVPEK